MSIWSRIAAALSSLAAGEGLSAVFEKLRTPPERSVAFTIAIIALGAKMAKADGQVTRDEVRAFREVFTIPPEAEQEAARVFNLARQDVAGFEVYARSIGKMFGNDSTVYCDLMDGLFNIAVADGTYKEAEDDFLHQVADLFGMSRANFNRVRARFVDEDFHDPYEVLGVEPHTPLDDIRKVWRTHVRETHPDAMTARGLPDEAIKMAEKRLIAINRAWDEIQEAA